jgi:hypothetical protein
MYCYHVASGLSTRKVNEGKSTGVVVSTLVTSRGYVS